MFASSALPGKELDQDLKPGGGVFLLLVFITSPSKPITLMGTMAATRFDVGAPLIAFGGLWVLSLLFQLGEAASIRRRVPFRHSH